MGTIADITKIESILKQYTAKEIALNTGISKSTISKLKSGERQIERINLKDAIILTDFAAKHLKADIEIWRYNK
ncbi:helix-turn-helix domain-containing protein [Enterococcus sp. HY326]|uniref:helix-turn-helix domain-containing protein n=1 Tax=Enterococcus sp. HY326 TaxID=2971265 RepID=UPI00223ECFC9|nr:helix-turn-helix domain-containing protein [Enterococcus sp. HY326]